MTEVSASVFVWMNSQDVRSYDGWSSRQEAEAATSFNSYSGRWTRQYIPGDSKWIDAGKLAAAYGKNYDKLSASQVEVGDSLSVILDSRGVKTANGARVGFGPDAGSGVQQVRLEPSNDGGIVLDGVTFALAPIYVDEPYRYD